MKPVTVIMVVLVTFLVFLLMVTVKPYYYFILIWELQQYKLDGVDFILAQSWPEAIREGNGNVLLLITNKANEEQRKSLSYDYCY